MAKSWLTLSITNKVRAVRRPVRKKVDHVRFRPQVEALADRVLPAVTATVTAADATLRIVGDALDNTVVVSRDAAGTILVNNGAIAILGGPATVANTREIFLNGAGGNDNLSLNEANGALPEAAFFGGDGNDTLVGGSGNDFFVGDAGTDTIVMGAGDDTFVWNSGDGSDVVEGQDGRDTMVFIGSDAAEKFDLTANGTRARFTRDVGGVAMDLNGVEEIDLDALGGADTVTVNDQSMTGLNTFNVDLDSSADTGLGDNQADTVIINGTDGNDFGQIRSNGIAIGSRIDATVSAIPFVHITGSEGGRDVLAVNTLGGNDVLDASDLAATNASQLIKLTVTGGAGNDTIVGSQGNDTFVWNPGDGSDTIDGGDAGTLGDNLVFNGSDLAERFVLSANGTRARVTRDLDGGSVDLGGVETITVNVLGGADTITVNDLTGTGVTQINLNLSGAVNGVAGDGQADSVIVNGTNGADVIPVIGRFVDTNLGVVAIDGGPDGGVVGELPYGLLINASEGATDALTVNGLGGNDTVDTSDMSATTTSQPIRLLVNGGAGNDAIVGGPAAETFVWNPGDGSDTINGGGGQDAVIVNGSDLAERFVLSASGSRTRVTRDLDGGSVDLGGVETITVNPLGGADTVTVNDLTGTAVTQINLDLAGAVGGAAGDGQADTVIVNGRNAADLIPILGNFIGANSGAILVNGGFANGSGLPYFLAIRATEGANDTLVVNALGGNDTVDASNLAAGQIKLTVTGGTGNDTIVGSQGGDTFVWNPGDGSDTIDGHTGLDLLTFNGSDAAEDFVIARDGFHVRLTRDVGNVTMDLNAVEAIALNARGGADTVTVNDLTGTGFINVQVDLSGPAGGGDGQADNVILNGTNGNDAIRLGASGNMVLVDGLVSAVVAGSDGVTDHLTVNALGGNDTVDSSGLPPNLIGLTVNLGDGQGIVATTTTLGTSTATAVFGQAEMLTATVNSPAGTPIGSVTFLDGSTVLGTVPVNANGQAILAVALGVGNHVLTASFAGSGGFTGSSSAAAAVTVNRAATTAGLGSSAKPAVTGRAVTFTATVAAVAPGTGTPTGTVTFFVGKKVVARVTLDGNGQARIRRAFSRTGRFTIRAVYGGDAHFAGSSQSLTDRVRRRPPGRQRG